MFKIFKIITVIETLLLILLKIWPLTSNVLNLVILATFKAVMENFFQVLGWSCMVSQMA